MTTESTTRTCMRAQPVTDQTLNRILILYYYVMCA